MATKKILVIDDSQTNLLLFESMFILDPRIEVLLRDNGIDIENYCLKEMPDLILLDLMMPDVNGFEVLEILQSNQILKSIPVIIVSALEGQNDIKRGIEMGAADYIVKPVDYDDNYQTILKILNLGNPTLD